MHYFDIQKLGFPHTLKESMDWGVAIVCCSLLLYCPTGDAITPRQPTLNIFSTQVIENIKETGDAARILETDLQSVIEELEKHQELYTESKCQGVVSDQGCDQISRQMASSYKAMLDTMANRLPEMERNIQITRGALKTQLAKELGRNRTGADLQRLLRNNKQSISSVQRTRVRQQGARLSDRFRKYFLLVNQSNTGSLALLGSEMYLDMDETLGLVQLTRQQIHRAQLYVDLSERMGTITPEMEQTVSEVKRIIFGEYDDDSDFVPATLETADKPGKFCSEFDANC